MTAGYSSTPLSKKLGMKPGCTVFAQGAPENYRRLLSPASADVRFVSSMSRDVDVAHLFSKSEASLAAAIKKTLARLRPDAVIWVSWPKKASKVATDVTEDTVRAIALPLGLVDIKVCAVDEVWSGLKLVVRKELRPAPPRER